MCICSKANQKLYTLGLMKGPRLAAWPQQNWVSIPSFSRPRSVMLESLNLQLWISLRSSHRWQDTQVTMPSDSRAFNDCQQCYSQYTNFRHCVTEVDVSQADEKCSVKTGEGGRQLTRLKAQSHRCCRQLCVTVDNCNVDIRVKLIQTPGSVHADILRQLSTSS